MQYENLEKAFQDKEFHTEAFIPLVMEQKAVRDRLIENLEEDTHINIYYRSYYLIDAVSKTNPELFYEYWNRLARLRFHKNSYHRNIFHWIITNLIPADKENQFDKIKDEYFSQIKDVKVLTGLEAVKDIIRMCAYRPDLEGEIISLLLNEELLEDYTDKQKDRFHCLAMEYFDTVLSRGKDERLMEFIRLCANAKNSTTARTAKQLIKKYEIN